MVAFIGTVRTKPTVAPTSTRCAPRLVNSPTMDDCDTRWLKRLPNDGRPNRDRAGLRNAHPAEPLMTVSHETIYRSIYIQTRGVLKKE